MITRFAPSPTGPLHLGHAYSALLAYDMARAAGGTFLLRMEDIDQTRARLDWDAQILDDLHWLGLKFPMDVRRQSDRIAIYNAALQDLWGRGLLYPCTCTRRDIQDAAAAPQEGAPLLGPDGIVYPGTCRPAQVPVGSMPVDMALRLNMTTALATLGNPEITWQETGIVTADLMSSDAIIQGVGDVVLARRDMGTSYHLSVVLDDSDQKISHVIRGADLAEATPIHIILQRLMGLPSPVYHHHRLIRDAAGIRLAKRDDSRAIAHYRNSGLTPSDIRHMVGLSLSVPE